MLYWWLGSINKVQRGYERSSDAWAIEERTAFLMQGCRGNGVFKETQISMKAEHGRNIH